MRTRRRAAWIAVAVPFLLLSLGALLLALAPEETLRDLFPMIEPDRTRSTLNPFELRLVRTTAGVMALGATAVAGLLVLRPPWLVRDISLLGRGLHREKERFRTGTSAVHRLALLGVVLLAVALRARWLSLPMGYDEAITYVRFASRGLLDIVSDYRIPNNHVLHTVLVHLSSGVLGADEITVRLPAFLAGVGVVPAVYLLGSRLFGWNAALLGAGLAAAAPGLVEYSVRARGYTLVALTFLVGWILATSLIKRSSPTAWCLFVLTLTAGCFTVPTMLYSVAALLLWLVLQRGRHLRAAWAARVGAAGVGVVALSTALYVPIIVRSGLRKLVSHPQTRPLPWVEFPSENLRRLGSVLECWTCPVHGPVAGVLVAASLAGWLRSSPERRRAIARAALALVAGPAALLLVQRIAPPARIYHPFLPAVLLFFGAGLAGWSRGRGAGRSVRWEGVAVAAALLWAALHAGRVQARGEGVPGGAEGIYCCAEGYFVDAPRIVERVEGRLTPRRVLVAHRYSGAVETLRFFLLADDRSPTLVHAYDHGRPARQLSRYETLFVVVKRPQGHDAPPATVHEELRVPKRELGRFFAPPVRMARFSASELYRLERRAVAPTGSR